MLLNLLKSFGLSVLSLLTVIVLISTIIFMSPVDPARLSFGQQLDEATLQAKRASLGLDKPLGTQIGYYLRDISPLVFTTESATSLENIVTQVSLGSHNLVIKKPYLRESYQTGRSVAAMIGQALPSTLILALAAICIAFFLGTLGGMLAARNEGGTLDQCLVAVSTLGYSVPSYVSAIFFALVFGYLLRGITGLNLQGGLTVLNDMGDEVLMLRNLILPALALGIRPVSVILQITRSAALEVKEQPYVLLATAKGLSKRIIERRYIFRNALNPVLTATTGWFASLLSGAFFVESVFNFRGFGQLTVNALLNYDVPLLLGCILTVSIMFILINVVMDMLYKLIDPRVR